MNSMLERPSRWLVDRIAKPTPLKYTATMTMNENTAHAVMQAELAARSEALERALDADLLTIVAGFFGGVEHLVREAVESVGDDRRPRLAIILQTNGGSPEVAERMVQVIRAHYSEVVFIVPDMALSAGTIFALSGDEILMDSFSVLGPIDPQIPRKVDGELKLVPALAYLTQYKRLIKKAADGLLTEAEFVLLQSFDLGELQQFEEAAELSIELVSSWLARYKFRSWDRTETSGQPVTAEMKQARAKEIARELNNHERWHSHGRGISMETLCAPAPEGLNIRIRDFGQEKDLAAVIRGYYDCLVSTWKLIGSDTFVGTKRQL